MREIATSHRVRFFGQQLCALHANKGRTRALPTDIARPRADRGSTGGKPAGNRYLWVPPKEAETRFSAYADFTGKL
jgi:hypothetical protein